MLKISSSILNADFRKLDTVFKTFEKFNIDYIHLDIMDGHFVKNITFGPIIVDAIHKMTKIPLDVHLMISEPDIYAERFLSAGANILSVHIETGKNIADIFQTIRKTNRKTGLVLNPDTDIKSAEPFFAFADIVMLMSVYPGLGGQKFIEKTVDRVKELYILRVEKKYDFEIEVDGGITAENVKSVVDAGADIVVVGAYLFKGEGTLEERIEKFNLAINGV